LKRNIGAKESFDRDVSMIDGIKEEEFKIKCVYGSKVRAPSWS
jgi:hypothetical protein